MVKEEKQADNEKWWEWEEENREERKEKGERDRGSRVASYHDWISQHGFIKESVVLSSFWRKVGYDGLGSIPTDPKKSIKGYFSGLIVEILSVLSI